MTKTIYYFDNGQWVMNQDSAYHAEALFGPLRGICVVPDGASVEEISTIVKENVAKE